MSQSTHNHYRYHIGMMLRELKECEEKFYDAAYTDTRVYLSLDRTELPIIKRLLNQELVSIEQTLLNLP